MLCVTLGKIQNIYLCLYKFPTRDKIKQLHVEYKVREGNRCCICAIILYGMIVVNHNMSWSRLLSLHTWLLSACRDYDLGFIDNFNLFWNR